MLVNRLNGQRYDVLRDSTDQPWSGSQASDYNLFEIVFIYQRPPMQEIHRTVTSLWAAWKKTTSSHVCRGHSCREMGPEIFQIHLQPSLLLGYFSQYISSRRQTRSKRWVEEVQVAKIACVTEARSPSQFTLRFTLPDLILIKLPLHILKEEQVAHWVRVSINRYKVQSVSRQCSTLRQLPRTSPPAEG